MIPPASPTPSALDIFIGGFLDKYTGLVVLYRQAFGKQHPDRTTCCFEHNQRRQIIATVSEAKAANPRLVVNLVGHSWGAATAVKVVNELSKRGLDIDLLITIDPVCRRKLGVDSAVTRWINVNAAPATSNGWDGDNYATLGGKWGHWPTRCSARHGNAEHCDAPFHHNEFTALFEYAPPGASSALDYLLRSCQPRSDCT